MPYKLNESSFFQLRLQLQQLKAAGGEEERNGQQKPAMTMKIMHQMMMIFMLFLHYQMMNQIRIMITVTKVMIVMTYMIYWH